MRLLPAVLVLLLAAASASAQSAQSAKEVYGEDIYWNATPDDVNHLLKNLKDFADINYNMDVKGLGEVSMDPERNPVLFRTGHYNFSYTPEERQKLRNFMLSGGMVVYNTGLGSAPFYRSIIRELAEIFPEQPVQRLSADHPIFHAFYDVDRVRYASGVAASGYRGDEPWFDAVEINCRVVALVSRWCMAVGWQDAVKEGQQAYMSDSAYKLGINIFSYASAMRAWARNAATAMKFVDKSAVDSDKVALVQLQYDGVWKTRHAGLSVLLHTFNQRTEVPVKFQVREMRMSEPAVFNSPLLYLTGHEHFTLNAKEIAALRQYLLNGGFLFAEACCGRKGFDLAFRQLMKQVLPDRPLQAIRDTSRMFNYPYELKTLGVTPTLAQELGQAAVPPMIEGIDVDGHVVVVYSRLGMAGGWEMSQSPYARGYDDVGSIKLGQCILMQAVTQ